MVSNSASKSLEKKAMSVFLSVPETRLSNNSETISRLFKQVEISRFFVCDYKVAEFSEIETM